MTVLRSTLMGAALSIAAFAAAQAQTLTQITAKMKAEFVGKPAPFAMKALDGKQITNEEFKGKVVLVDFWATWCGPCKLASPKLEAMYKAWKDDGLVVIAANAGENNASDEQQKEKALAYVAEHKYTYPFTYLNDKLAEKWKVPGYPTFFVIGRDGLVKNIVLGFTDDKEKEIRDSVRSQLDTRNP